MKCCINDVNFIRLLLSSTELFKFEIRKYGQILCVHKPFFSCRVTYKDVKLCPTKTYYTLTNCMINSNQLYRISGNIDSDFNLMIWRITFQSSNSNSPLPLAI